MPSFPRVRSRALIAGVLSAGIVAFAAAPVAYAVETPVNPFASSGGFTIVASGDVSLGNHELEGSVAVGGTLSTPSGNYPIIHHVAGSGDYTVPLIDGVPVRVLADRLGSGTFDITNAGATSGTPESNAVAKLVDTSDVTASSNNGRVTLESRAGGVLHLPGMPHSEHALADVATERDSVAAYVGSTAAVTSCLSTVYDTERVNHVAIEEQGGLVFASGFAVDRPNVMDYADLAEDWGPKVIKRDRFDGYVPTAEAPLIIRVPAGTSAIGPVLIEGWSAQQGQQQTLARFIMLDMSAVTGAVTISGLELGAVYAPNADVTFDSGVSHNGQWITRSFTARGGGELHHHLFGGLIPCASDGPTEPTDPTEPSDPTDPAGPSDPTDPADPTNPAGPSDPTDPADPSEIVVPTAPGAPAGSAAVSAAANEAGGAGGLAVTGGALNGLVVAAGVALAASGLLLLAARSRGRLR